MLLTITTIRPPGTDLGYLLHKHPGRLQSFPMSFGQAHVFYPEASDERCTAALLLDVDPSGQSGIDSVAFSRDGTRLATVTGNGTLRVWSPVLLSTDYDPWRARLCPVAGRNLTRAEWNAFVSGQTYHQTCPRAAGRSEVKIDAAALPAQPPKAWTSTDSGGLNGRRLGWAQCARQGGAPSAASIAGAPRIGAELSVAPASTMMAAGRPGRPNACSIRDDGSRVIGDWSPADRLSSSEPSATTTS
jgi:hypothetical protein